MADRLHPRGDRDSADGFRRSFVAAEEDRVLNTDVLNAGRVDIRRLLPFHRGGHRQRRLGRRSFMGSRVSGNCRAAGRHGSSRRADRGRGANQKVIATAFLPLPLGGD